MHVSPHRTSRILRASAIIGATVLLAAGCNKKADNTSNYKSAIDSYYSAHPACLWHSEQKFPMQVDTSDQSKTAPFDALVDQGLLVRTTAEKKKMIIASKQVTNYDLSDKGRSVWTADTTQPGYGNFCFGHRKVSSIDSSTPTNDQEGATTTVNYHYTIDSAADWAKAPETQNAYPQLHADLSGPQAAVANLIDTHNGWQFANTPGDTNPSNPDAPATPADGKIVH